MGAEDGTKKKLSAGAIAGIVVGVILFVVLLLILLAYGVLSYVTRY